MSKETLYKILAEFQSYEEKEFSGVNKYIVSYKQPNSTDPSKVWKHQAVEADLSDSAVEILVSASAGERFCVHQGKDGQYPVITDITDAKDAPAKTVGGNSKYKNGNNYKPRDDAGIAIGAAWTNAIEIIKLTGIINPNYQLLTQDVAKLAEEIVKLKLVQEDKLRAAKAAKEATKEKANEEAKPLSRAEQIKAKKAAETGKQEESKAKKTKKEAVSEPIPEQEDVVEPDDEEDDQDELEVKF